MTHAIITLTVTDPTAMDAYRAQAAVAMNSHGISVVQVSTAPQALDGQPHLPTVCVIVKFPDTDAAQAWMDDPALAEIHALRRAAGKVGITMLA